MNKKMVTSSVSSSLSVILSNEASLFALSNLLGGRSRGRESRRHFNETDRVEDILKTEK